MRIRQPPTTDAGVLDYLREVASALNALPNVSTFTGITPAGRVIGGRGDLAVALDASTSTTSLWWYNGNPVGVVSNQSWYRVGLI